MSGLLLPQPDGRLERYTVLDRPVVEPPHQPSQSRAAFAATHVVADPFRSAQDGRAELDWDATLAYRRHVWSCGLGVAEAMDTAQRGMGLGWESVKELIWRSCKEAKAVAGRITCGASTDQLTGVNASLDDILNAYSEQAAFIEASGAQVTVMASRHLVAAARGPDDYVRVVGALLSQLQQPPILHWLGEVFDPALGGYWGSHDLDVAAGTVLEIVGEYPVDGVKVSLLDPERERELRRKLPGGVKLYTGDDFNYPSLILGDEQGHSDALLGVFDAIAPIAAAALLALDAGEHDRYRSLLEPTAPLARHLFGAPTRFYKTGIVFLAYLNGHQDHFRMVAGAESGRNVIHLAEIFRLADRAGLLIDPESAVRRMSATLELAGVSQPGSGR